jgi:hypothetical protein
VHRGGKICTFRQLFTISGAIDLAGIGAKMKKIRAFLAKTAIFEKKKTRGEGNFLTSVLICYIAISG